MPLQRLLIPLLFGLLAWLPLASVRAEEALLPPEQAFRLSAQAAARDRLLLAFDIADGYHL
ncbi:MAG TPA: hypothetical protein VI457_12095, partial [Methylococcaceae bacterium]|nr:hypothetical protein [Methylococcaceae bacterium]